MAEITVILTQQSPKWSLECRSTSCGMQLFSSSL